MEAGRTEKVLCGRGPGRVVAAQGQCKNVLCPGVGAQLGWPWI